MKRETVFERWRGTGHPWVTWVRPALFEGIGDELVDDAVDGHVYRTKRAPWSVIDTSWYVAGAAVIIDLAAEDAITVALALGMRGVRPVLSINACSAEGEVIPMRRAIDLLVAGARSPRAFPSGAKAPPAFVLDARRSAGGREPPVGSFDNRWAIFAGDMPTSNDLFGERIARVIVVQSGPRALGDLETTLRRYQRDGLELLLLDVDEPRELTPLTLDNPSWVERLMDGARRRFSLPPRRWDGSFGRRVPIPEEPRYG